MSAERKAMGGFMGFAIRIDVLGSGAIYAFNRMRAAAMLAFAAVNKIVSAVLEFETGMGDLTRIVAINTKTTEDLTTQTEYLRTTILAMARDSVQGINDITAAYAYAVRAGYDVVQATKLVADAMLLATATGGDLDEITKVVNRLGNIWRVAGLPIVDIVDKIVASEAEFAMTTEELMTALNMAGSVSSQAGMSFEQTATMLGFMYDAGINASTAGTTLRRAIKNLVAPSNENTEAIERLGISYAYLQTLPIEDQFKAIGDKLLNVADNNQRLNLAFEIFGVRASNIFPVLEQMGDSFDEMVEKLEASEGAAQRAADAYEDTLIGKLTMMKNLFDSVITSIGQWSVSLEGATMVLLGLGGGMWAMTNAFTFISSGITSSVPLWQLFIEKVVRLNSTISKSVGVSNMWTVASSRFNLGMKQGLKSISFFNKGIGTSIGLMKKNIGTTYKLAFGWLFQGRAAKKAGTAVQRKSLKMMFSSIVDIIKTITTWSLNAALTVLNIVLSPISLILMAIGIAVMFFVKQMKEGTAIGKFFTSIFEDVKAVLEAIWSVIKAVISIFMIFVKIVLAPLLIGIAIAMPIIKIVLLVIRIIATVVGHIINKISEFVKRIVEVVKNTKFMIKAFEFVQKIIKHIVQFFVWIINGLIWVMNYFLPKAKELEYFDVESLMAGKKEDEPVEDDTVDTTTDTEEEPVEPDVPVGSSRTPSGGKSGGNYNITIYITADMYEMMETERFAEYIGIEIMKQIARQKGAGEL